MNIYIYIITYFIIFITSLYSIFHLCVLSLWHTQYVPFSDNTTFNFPLHVSPQIGHFFGITLYISFLFNTYFADDLSRNNSNIVLNNQATTINMTPTIAM